MRHETRYDYGEPVEHAHHMAHLRPRDADWQRVRDWTLRISPWPDGAEEVATQGLGEAPAVASARAHGPVPEGAAASPGAVAGDELPPADPGSVHDGGNDSPGLHQSLDAWGNWRAVFSHSRVHSRLVVEASFTVELQPRSRHRVHESPPWELVARRLRYQPGGTFDGAIEYVLPSFHAPRDPALARLAQEAFMPGTPLLAGAYALMHLIHRRFEYRPSATSVATRATEALALRRGVCQDFAHVMIGAMRSIGLAARYVSGYLLTHPPPGQPRLVGADASHAWVSVWCPAHGWVALDPTNGVPVGLDHVTLAWGRDYEDVAPLRGVIRGGGQAALQVSVTVEPEGAPAVIAAGAAR